MHMVCPGDQWRRSHNFMHHTYTNVLDKDRDVGYGILRISEDQQWHPCYLGNPLYAVPSDRPDLRPDQGLRPCSARQPRPRLDS
jgi:hypothetical protein